VRLGWSHGDQEVFTLEEMQALFDIKDVNKSASAFNPDKLLWLNQQHIMRTTPQALVPHLKFQFAALGVTVEDDAKLAAVAKAQQERAKTLKEMAQNSLFFFTELKGYDEKAAKKNLTAESAAVLGAVRDRLSSLQDWRAAEIHETVNAVATSLNVGLGKVAQPIRVAVSGTSVSPPIDVTLEVLGREITVARLGSAIAHCA
jgi:glutamyl-tRNA synthetase